MNSIAQLLRYIDEEVHCDNMFQWLVDNRLMHIVGSHYDKCSKHAEEYLIVNKIACMENLKALIEVCQLFEREKVDYIVFKGGLLSKRLYNSPLLRPSGDLDVFVPSNHFEKAHRLLLDSGYVYKDGAAQEDAHHLVLKKNAILLELHRRILSPAVNIDETYLHKNTEHVIVNGMSIRTFNTTATFLHLLYHLYMDTMLVYESLYLQLINNGQPKAKKFIFRAFEISLFSELFSHQIIWDEITTDIKKQKLSSIFNIFVEDILAIFPNAFPNSFLTAATKKAANYEQLLIHTNHVCLEPVYRDRKIALSNFINAMWKENIQKNILLDREGAFQLRSAVSEQEKSIPFCKVKIQKNEDCLRIEFDIHCHDCYFSDVNNFNTQGSDGVHIIVCGVKRYFYDSVFLFPKYINEEVVILPVNVLDEQHPRVVDSKHIQGTYEWKSFGYRVTAFIFDEYLCQNDLEESFYLGLVISNCSSTTKSRKYELTLTEDPSEWYNPIFYAKISM